ncbi:MAG: type I-U CRISPR-associated RAMP protein Csb1/Cas7u [Candidatus Tectomicrobia bacterium]|nr:type I-U CRISPR-associated RAMP protein Csb1/Cas7u [Candidatus Tectomicrobia bacterium]
MPDKLDLQTLRDAVSGTAAAFRCVTDYQPAGGPGDKVFPPTYAGGKYATEERVDPATGEVRPCVLLDSVQSQANRMELALLEAHRADAVKLPLIVTRFNQNELLRKFAVTSLEAPHRAADALFRDSLLNGVMFRKSDKGRVLDTTDIRNATGLFGLCPTALVFGLWDSTGPRGGSGAKFQRALVSEIIGYHAVAGVKTSSRIDPAQIRLGAAVLYRRDIGREDAPDWVLDEGSAKLGSGRNPSGRPSEAVHGNITPDISEGGFTVSRARQTTTLSLAVLRRLRFPLNGVSDSVPEVDLTARTVLAALGLAAGTLVRSDVDLRSRCQLFAEGESAWNLLDRPAETPREFELDTEAALALLTNAIEAARKSGLPWDDVIELTPSPDLIELVRRSQELASEPGAVEA